MNKNSTITKLVLGIAISILVVGQAFAAKRKSNSSFNRSMINYRAAPVQTYYRVPFGYSISQGGIYHNDVLPDGTVTGPIAPHANGG
jgi:hypothetical protein